MSFCGQCGQDVAGLRFCTRCGAAVDDAPRAERPGPVEHPVADDREPDDTPPIWAPYDPDPEPTTVAAPAYAAPAPRRTGRWVPWVIAAWVVLAVVAAIVAWRVGVGDVEEARGVTRPATTSPAPVEPSVTESEAATETPSEDPTESATEAPAEPTDLARTATAVVPATAPPNQDVDGDVVRYEAGNLLDGVPTTAWRMPGDGAGSELTFTFPQPVTLTQVGLVNGYAKVEGGADWYMRNRRLVSAEWVFDDGTVVPESFADSLDPQLLDVGPVTTTTVRLRIVETTRPARGPDGRDFTPISDVVLVGSPAG